MAHSHFQSIQPRDCILPNLQNLQVIGVTTTPLNNSLPIFTELELFHTYIPTKSLGLHE